MRLRSYCVDARSTNIQCLRIPPSHRALKLNLPHWIHFKRKDMLPQVNYNSVLYLFYIHALTVYPIHSCGSVDLEDCTPSGC